MTSPHIIERVRHELVSRRVTVSSVEPLTPRVLRIDFESPELEGFHSPAADDHIAIFFPSDEAPDGESKRHYTPRAFAPGVRRLTIDFVLHQAGPASDWARQ
ncbi:MAG TPA: siderophore-interacting protein, partial [Polyangiaceae bacterium]|nr:siderophore-interacting protein [Polyangiaceae bacterium]